MADNEYDPQTELDNAIHESEEVESELETLIREHFGVEEDEEVSGPSESSSPEGEESVPAADSSPETETSPVDSDIWEWESGLKLTKDEAQSLAEFSAFLNDNPELADAIRETIATRYQQQQTPPPPPPPPENIDLDDPTIKFLWDQLQESNQRVEAANQAIQRHEMQLTTQTETTANSMVERAVASFQKEHSLTDDQMGQVRQIAGQMNIIESVFGATDPITGQPRKIDPLTAVDKALDIAYWSIPEFRDKEIERQLTANRTDQQKKRKLSSLGGSSGSVPREQPAPTTKEEIQSAMIKEVAQYMGTTPSV